MQADGFRRNKYHGLTTSQLTVGVSLKVYKFIVFFLLRQPNCCASFGHFWNCDFLNSVHYLSILPFLQYCNLNNKNKTSCVVLQEKWRKRKKRLCCELDLTFCVIIYLIWEGRLILFEDIAVAQHWIFTWLQHDPQMSRSAVWVWTCVNRT